MGGLYSKQYLEGQLAVALGGRLAEELVYGDVGTTTGASNDLQQVTSIASRMINEWGMSEKVGPIALSGGQMSQEPWSGEIQATASEEVKRLVNNAYVLAKKLLTEKETVSAEEFQVLISKYGKYMSPYEVFGEGYGDEALPFQGIELDDTPKHMAVPAAV